MTRLRDRSTTDVVVILLTAMVAISVMFLTLGVIIARITRPELEPRGAIELLGNIFTTIVGALVGFIGGRAAGRAEQAKIDDT